MAAGQLTINGIDAFTRWGIGLEPEGMDALMALPPMKQPTVNKNVTADGAVVVKSTTGITDERTVVVPMHLIAADKSSFIANYSAFRSLLIEGMQVGEEITHKLTIVLSIGGGTTFTYEMYYINCSQYTQFLNGMAKFALTLYEPKTVYPQEQEPEQTEEEQEEQE